MVEPRQPGPESLLNTVPRNPAVKFLSCSNSLAWKFFRAGSRVYAFVHHQCLAQGLLHRKNAKNSGFVVNVILSIITSSSSILMVLCWLCSFTSHSLSRLWASSRRCLDAIFLCLFGFSAAFLVKTRQHMWIWAGLPMTDCRQIEGQILEPRGSRTKILCVVQEQVQRKWGRARN